MADPQPYVTNAAWTKRAGRIDAIDDVADQFERPTGGEQFWQTRAEGPRQSRGWRSMGRLHRGSGVRAAIVG